MPILELSMITGALVDAAIEATLNHLERREAVIRVRKRLGMDTSPPDDFDAIYARALVEYGIFKPEPILTFFRNEFIRSAFREAFYRGDQSILEREAEGIIEWNEETHKLGKIDYDPRREFAAFTVIFQTILANIRTPLQVRQDHRLDELLERLETLKLSTDIHKETIDSGTTATAQVASASHNQAIKHGSQKKFRALVIEDVASHRKILTQALRSLDISCVNVSNLDKSIAAIKSSTFDLICLDMQLDAFDNQGQTGLMLLDQMQIYQPKSVVIIISGLNWATRDVRKFFVRYGVADFFTKPVDLDEFRLRVQSILAIKKEAR